MSRWLRRFILLSLFYLAASALVAVVVMEGAFHPAHRPLTLADETTMSQIARGLDATLKDVSITASDGAQLKAWSIQPTHRNGNTVLLLHGLGDNRFGMTGYAEMFLSHGFGESMGAAQLLQALEVEPHFCAVVAESPFSTFREISYDRVGQFFRTGPWLGRTLFRSTVELAFLYARWKYKVDFSKVSPQEVVATTHVPVFLIHGASDRNIPVRHSHLIVTASPNVIFWEVPKTDHCGAMSTSPAEFETKVISWATNHPEDPLLKLNSN